MTLFFFKNLANLSSVALIAVGLLPVFMVPCAKAADAPKKPVKDVLIFKNGEKLVGALDHEVDGKVYFKSDNVGMVAVSWSAIQTLQASKPFAVLEKGAFVRRHRSNFNVPVGPISVHGDTLTVHASGGAQQIPVKTVSYLVDHPTFDKNVLKGQSPWQGFAGRITAGTSLVYSTQNSRSINTSVALIRKVPAVAWLPPQGRTSLDFSSNFGQVTQANTPTVKTNIVHGALEQDEYFVRRFYLLQQAVFDHNSSQGLDLQQLYGVGVGYKAMKDSKQELDLTATAGYTKQQLADTPENDLVGSSIGDTYNRKFPRKFVFSQVGAFHPAWNKLDDYSANIAANLSFPVFQGFGFTVGVVDSYLNKPATGFKGNSVQFNTGLTYMLH